MTVFGPELHDLTREDVLRHLREAEAEPLLWEAKGVALDKHRIRKEVCAFANGIDPGYLILGAEKNGSEWSVPGVEFTDEPPVWVASVINDGVRPVPVLDVRTLAGESETKRVAVVEVQPVATPPCFTRGTIYERIAGAAVHVKEPTRLAELYRRGRAAHTGAQAGADGMAHELIDWRGFPHLERQYARFALALSPTGNPPDITSRLFSQDFAQSLTDAAHDHLVWAVSNPPSILPEMTQSSSVVKFMDLHSGNYKRHWWVQARWDGTVGIHYSTEIEPVTAEQMASGPVKEAWAAASALVRQLGGYGDAYFALRTKGGAGMRTSDGKNLDANIRRGPFSIVPDDEMVASVERELRRAAGETVYEPS